MINKIQKLKRVIFCTMYRWHLQLQNVKRVSHTWLYVKEGCGIPSAFCTSAKGTNDVFVAICQITPAPAV